ncbi:hypothetical protein M885DRAFT_550592 [Pelagophyceae sp. CCMP2097]|nr:hypothetical protein M885DRAFT_550592 [Pelagophyceae sp. CCMP2097]
MGSGLSGISQLPDPVPRAVAAELLGAAFDAAAWAALADGAACVDRAALLHHIDGQSQAASPAGESCALHGADGASPAGDSRALDDADGASPGDGAMTRTETDSRRTQLADRFFSDLGDFFAHRRDIDTLWASLSTGLVVRIEAVGPDDGVGDWSDSLRQAACGTGKPVATVDELYAAAGAAKPAFDMLMRRCAKDAAARGDASPRSLRGDAATVKLAALKGVPRTVEKALHKYGDRPDSLSWVDDIVRGTVICDSEEELVAFHALIVGSPGVDVVKLSNRFARPTAAGIRDINIKFRLDPHAAAGAALRGVIPADAAQHVCEIQLHLRRLSEFSKSRCSHRFYEFFRQFFRGNWAEVSVQAQALHSLFANGVASFHDAVESATTDSTAATIEALAHLSSERFALHDLAASLYGRLAERRAEEHRSKRHASVGLALLRRGFALQGLGAHDDAIAAFREALAPLMSLPAAYVECCAAGLGRSSFAVGDAAGAAAIYQRALAMLKQLGLEAQSGGVLLERATLQSLHGHHVEALADVDAAERLLRDICADECPQVGVCWMARAEALRSRALSARHAGAAVDAALVEAALAEARRAAELLHRLTGDASALTAQAHLCLARLLLLRGARGDADDAAVCAAKAAEISPALIFEADARAALSEALERVGHTGDAQRQRRAAAGLLRGAKNRRGDTLFRVLLADAAALQRQGELAAALEVCSGALAEAHAQQSPPDLVVAHHRLAALHESLGLSSHPKAIDHLEHALVATYALLEGAARHATAGESLDDRFGPRGALLKGPPARVALAAELHQDLAELHPRDKKRAIFHLESAVVFLRAAGNAKWAAHVDAEAGKLRDALEHMPTRERAHSKESKDSTSHAHGAKKKSVTSPRAPHTSSPPPPHAGRHGAKSVARPRVASK